MIGSFSSMGSSMKGRCWSSMGRCWSWGEVGEILSGGRQTWPEFSSLGLISPELCTAVNIVTIIRMQDL